MVRLLSESEVGHGMVEPAKLTHEQYLRESVRLRGGHAARKAEVDSVVAEESRLSLNRRRE